MDSNDGYTHTDVEFSSIQEWMFRTPAHIYAYIRTHVYNHVHKSILSDLIVYMCTVHTHKNLF